MSSFMPRKCLYINRLAKHLDELCAVLLRPPFLAKNQKISDSNLAIITVSVPNLSIFDILIFGNYTHYYKKTHHPATNKRCDWFATQLIYLDRGGLDRNDRGGPGWLRGAHIPGWHGRIDG